MSRIKQRVARALIPLALVAHAGGTATPVLAAQVEVRADAVISADTAGGAYTTLVGPVLREDVSGDFPVGQVVIAAPSGFVFGTSSVSVQAGGAGNLTLGATTCTSPSKSITITRDADLKLKFRICSLTGGSQKTRITLGGVTVRPTAGTPLAEGDITLDSTSIALAGILRGVTSLGHLQVVPGARASITLAPGAATITAGSSQAFAVHSYDQFGNPLGDVTDSTTISIDEGSCEGAACTSARAGDRIVTASNGDLAAHATLTVVPADLSSLALSVADTTEAGSAVGITAEGFDQFGNSRGDLTNAATYTISPNGSCAGAECVSTVAGAHTVAASVDDVVATAPLLVAPAAAASLSAALSADTLVADGVASATLTATVHDAYGNARPSDAVAVATDGDAAVPSLLTAAGDGSYTGTVTASTTAGDETLTVALGALSQTLTLHEIAGAPATVAVAASPSVVNASPGSGNTSTVSIVVRDAFGNLVPDAAVSFALTESGSGLGVAAALDPSLSATAATTDASGAASITYTAGARPGEDEITATAGAASGSAPITVRAAACTDDLPAEICPRPAVSDGAASILRR